MVIDVQIRIVAFFIYFFIVVISHFVVLYPTDKVKSPVMKDMVQRFSAVF